MLAFHTLIWEQNEKMYLYDAADCDITLSLGCTYREIIDSRYHPAITKVPRHHCHLQFARLVLGHRAAAQPIGHVQLQRSPLLRLEVPHVRHAILAARHKAQSAVRPLDRVHRVRVRLRLQNAFRSLLGHQVHAHMMIGRAGRQEHAARRERRAYHLRLARPQLLVILYRFRRELRFAAARRAVLPERHRAIGAGRHQVLEFGARRRAKVHRRYHAGVAGQHRNRTGRLQVPHAQNAIQRAGRQQRIVQIHRDVGDLGAGAAERRQQPAVDGAPQFHQQIIGARDDVLAGAIEQHAVHRRQMAERAPQQQQFLVEARRHGKPPVQRTGHLTAEQHMDDVVVRTALQRFGQRLGVQPGAMVAQRFRAHNRRRRAQHTLAAGAQQRCDASDARLRQRAGLLEEAGHAVAYLEQMLGRDVLVFVLELRKRLRVLGAEPVESRRQNLWKWMRTRLRL